MLYSDYSVGAGSGRARSRNRLSGRAGAGLVDRRGEYLYELGYEHKGFEEITFEVKIESKESEEKIREFIKWADRSPPHATLRRAVRLIGIFHLNGRHLTTAVYHPDRTEWR
jgi:hypothetical protein